MVRELFGRKSEQKKEEEWLNIVEDMVEICTSLFKGQGKDGKGQREESEE